MGVVSIRELQSQIKRVIARVERGETIEVTRRRRPVARLVPLGAGEKPKPWPNLKERTAKVFGKGRRVRPGGAEEVLSSRGSR